MWHVNSFFLLQVRPSEALMINHYSCSCVKELWVLLVHLLDHRSKWSVAEVSWKNWYLVVVTSSYIEFLYVCRRMATQITHSIVCIVGYSPRWWACIFQRTCINRIYREVCYKRLTSTVVEAVPRMETAENWLHKLQSESKGLKGRGVLLWELS